jgi:hypothetical protein
MYLNPYEKAYYSQNGEDGIIMEIRKRISLSSDFFVEFGVETGIQCNCRFLYESGWKGLMIEGNEDYYKQLRNSYDIHNLRAVHSFITKDNIIDIFENNNVPKDLGLLSVDIDGNDYWVLKEVLMAQYRPSIIVAEYNSYYQPPRKWIMKYNPEHTWKDNTHYGASLQSMTSLCNNHGYALVCTDKRGVNAFYVRRDVLGDNLVELTPSEAYHPAGYYGLYGGLGHQYIEGEYVEE